MDCADRIAMMMLDVKKHDGPLIVSPSHGRAGRVKVFEVIPDIALCVAESQEPAYRAAYPDAELIVHPDELKGIAPKRQWLLDNFGDVFMLDDDVKYMMDMMELEEGAKSPRIRDGQVVRDLICRLFDQAEQMGAYLVGFGNFANPVAAKPQAPFGLTGLIAGRAMGIRAGSKLELPANQRLMTDDMYLSALNAYYHRFLLRDERYVFMAPGTWGNDGGMAGHRTYERLLENNRYLKAMFGEAFEKKTGSPVAKIKNDAQLRLRIPW